MTGPRFTSGKSDTTPEARRVLCDFYRGMSLAQKLRLVFEIQEIDQYLITAGLRTRYPDVSEEEIWHLWARQHLGDKLYEEVYGSRNNLGASKNGG